MTTKVENPCEGLSKSEVQAFERIAFNMPPQCSAKTIKKLLDAGLIERHQQVLAVDRLGPVVRYEYSVPIALHFQWCEYRSRPKSKGRRSKPAVVAEIDDLPLFRYGGKSQPG